MNAMKQIKKKGDEPGLALIDMPWGFRMRPADMDKGGTDAVIEIALTALGTLLILTAFGQWLLPGSLYSGDMLSVKLFLTVVLAVIGGGILSVSARGFRPEVQVDAVRHEIRFLSRNARGRGRVLATVDLDRIIGVGITRSIDGPDCHCLLYILNGAKPLRLATGSEAEVRAIKARMETFVTTPEERLSARMERATPTVQKSPEKTAA
jgi:hypothetical protein